MLPAHVRDPDTAAFWITDWFVRLGGERVVPEGPVTVARERTGSVSELRVLAVVHFADGRRLNVTVRLGPELQPLRYTFDLIGAEGRLWGRHGHREKAGFHHRHDLPGFDPVPAASPATFLDIETLLYPRMSGPLAGQEDLHWGRSTVW